MLLLTSLVIFICCALANATNTTATSEETSLDSCVMIEAILVIVAAMEGVLIAFITTKYKNKTSLLI